MGATWSSENPDERQSVHSGNSLSQKSKVLELLLPRQPHSHLHNASAYEDRSDLPENHLTDITAAESKNRCSPYNHPYYRVEDLDENGANIYSLSNLKEWVLSDQARAFRILQHPFFAFNPNSHTEGNLFHRQEQLEHFLQEHRPDLLVMSDIEAQLVKELDRRWANLQVAAVRQSPDSFLQASDQISAESVAFVMGPNFEYPPETVEIPNENTMFVAPVVVGLPAEPPKKPTDL